MTSSSFYLRPEDEALLAKGYASPTGSPVTYPQIYLRPAGNLHTSASDLGKFVHVLLNWGETPEDLVIDPEYLSNMEHPRTTLASAAGLHSGYGTGIGNLTIDGFPMLGHGGGIEGFISQFAYSTSRDVGFVVLLNSTHSGEAMRRIMALAVRYLKSGIEPPPKPEEKVTEDVLRGYEGYYHPANPRNQAFAFIEWLMTGQSIRVDGNRLQLRPVFGENSTLIPVSDTLFRFEADPEPMRVFTKDEHGVTILTGGNAYLERRPRWRVDAIRWPVLVSAALSLTPLVMLLPWIIRHVLSRRSAMREGGRAGPSGFWWLKTYLVLCSIGLLLPVIGAMNTPAMQLGTRNAWTAAMFAGSVLYPAAAVLSLLLTVNAFMSGAGKWLRAYALTISIAALIVSAYLSSWGMIAFRPWSF